MYQCPWCERKSFSFWQKQALGPNNSMKCHGCRRQVSVHWGRAHLAALPVFILAIAGLWFIGDSFNSSSSRSRAHSWRVLGRYHHAALPHTCLG